MFARFKTLQAGAAEHEAFIATAMEFLSNGSGWLVPDRLLNRPQVKAIHTLRERAQHANFIDVQLRIAGSFEYHQADFVKKFVRHII